MTDSHVDLTKKTAPPQEKADDEFSPPPRQKPQRTRLRYYPCEPQEWDEDAPHLCVPEWEALGLNELPLDLVSRHVLALGETGAGKTASAVLPMLRAVARHRTEDGPHAILLIDPKRELAAELDTLAEESAGAELVRFGGDEGPVLDRFEGTDALDLTAAEVARRILEPSGSYRREREVTKDSFFISAGERLLEGLVELDLSLYRAGGIQFVAAFWARVPEHMYGPAPDLSYRRDHYLSRILAFLRYASDHQDSAYRALRETLAEFGMKDTAESVHTRMADDTYSSVVSSLSNALREAASEEVARCVSLNPLEPPSNPISVRSAMEAGQWIVFQPSGRSLTEDYIGRSLKSSYFSATFQRRSGRGCWYIADEAHRFITGDPETGEQSYLDRCRAYRAGCVLATQSVASLAYGLQSGSSGSVTNSALDIVLSNVGTTLYFRTSDPSTTDRLRNLLPDPALIDRPHIIDVRPPVSLAVGECYAMVGDGEWGRFQIDLQPVPQRAQAEQAEVYGRED